jgi:hypothetical protein
MQAQTASRERGQQIRSPYLQRKIANRRFGMEFARRNWCVIWRVTEGELLVSAYKVKGVIQALICCCRLNQRCGTIRHAFLKTASYPAGLFNITTEELIAAFRTAKCRDATAQHQWTRSSACDGWQHERETET